MGGGGRNQGPDPATQRAQEQQFLLEQERIRLEQEAAAAQQRELELLQQQLAQQSEITTQQITTLGTLQQQAEAQAESFASLLEQATAEQARQADFAAQESLRAQAGERQQQQAAAAGLTTQIETTARRRRVSRAQPTSLLLTEQERQGLLV